MSLSSYYWDKKHPHYSEFLPIIDDEGNIVRVENRVKTHLELFIHPVVRGIILTPDGKVIMQKKRLKTLPLEVLDTTISWHIGGPLEDMEKFIGQNVSTLLIPTLQIEAKEEVWVDITPHDIKYLGQTWLYSDLPEKTEIAYVMILDTRRRVRDISSPEWLKFEEIDIEEIISADRNWRIAWDIIGEPWTHIWEQVQKNI